MTDSTTQWVSWDRPALRTVFPSQLSLFEQRLRETGCLLDEPSSTRQSFIHRIALLLWIDEADLARKLYEEEKHWLGASFEGFLFNLVILVRDRGALGWYFNHPEFGSVRYSLLWSGEKFSTTPLSDLLKMENPCVSTPDGFLNAGFDKGELDKLTQIFPQEYHGQIRLPLILIGPLTGENYGAYKLMGGKAEEFLLQRLMKATNAPFDKFEETREKIVSSISMLKRRHFRTIYKVFFGFERPYQSGVWLSARYDSPYL
jgi:uncharacterized protein (UPF0216 family)